MSAHEWATKLALEIAPDEAVLAPIVVDAFLAGGRERRDLFASSSGTLGGFSAGDVTAALPAVLQSIAVAGPLLLSALAAPNLGNLIGAVDNGLKLAVLREKRAAADESNSAKPGVPSGDRSSVVDEASPLFQVVETMRRELRRSGVGAERCDAIAYRTLQVLFTDPGNAANFVEMTTQAR